jgi:hypothetical protein
MWLQLSLPANPTITKLSLVGFSVHVCYSSKDEKLKMTPKIIIIKTNNNNNK